MNILGCSTSYELLDGMPGDSQLNFMATNDNNKVGNYHEVWNFTFSSILHQFKFIHQMPPRAAQNIWNHSSHNMEQFCTF